MLPGMRFEALLVPAAVVAGMSFGVEKEWGVAVGGVDLTGDEFGESCSTRAVPAGLILALELRSLGGVLSALCMDCWMAS